ncbi:AAA family ATPase [Streptomyces griseorubens]|uniref:AAA family ATPase n=1 Tax=Streptomyces griseorubens TaxID=66897 RepID=UPI0035172289
MTVRRDDKEPARYRPDLVIGREELFADARAQLARGGSVLLHGPAGIGKSTVLRALAAENAAATSRVLRCSATESESHLPFLALADLFGLVLDEVAPRLPAAQRTALESALTGRGESTLQRDGLALRLAVLSTLRALSAEGPVLVVADDLQWLDPASAELLGFAARRLGDSPVRMLCAVRTEGEEYDRHLRACPPDTLAVRLGPFSRTEVSALLDHRGYTSLSRSTVRDIHRTSGGNPLFALELGRALAESPARPRPGEPLPVPTSLRALVLSRLEMLSDEARRTLLVAGDAQAAVHSLRRVRELEQGMGITDPARGRWQGDLAEALVRIGEPGEAQELINVTRVHALRLNRASVLAVLDRAEALVRAARGEHQAALAQLTSAQERLAKLGYGLEEARAAFARARLRSRGPGPAGYDEAARLFRRCRALPWLRQVDEAVAAGPAEADPMPPATPAALDGLASMERQVAALVMEGATNREIAGRLFISVKTVEATLTRVYRKLGIRSRVDIVRLAAGRRAP